MRRELAAPAAAVLNCASRFWRAGVAALALGGAVTVASAPADIARGLAWLHAQVQVDGSFLSSSATAAPVQTRCETAATLLKLAGGSAQVNALLAAMQPQSPDEATESVACWQQLRQQLGQSTAGEVDVRRVAQQGYAPFEGFDVSVALDTGWALGARLQTLSSTEKSTLLGWLKANQASTGSFATAGRPDIVVTAAIVRGLQAEAPKNSAAAAIAATAAASLLSQRSAQGHWLNDVAVTALVFEAVHPYTGADPSIASSVEAYLLAAQSADGSWAADPYLTAVALRALALTSVPPVDPGASAATVRGVVTLAGSGEALSGVTVKAQPASGAAGSIVTDAQGTYVLQGITPGGITLTASLAGYQTLTAQVTVAAGGVAVFSPAMVLAGSTPPTDTRIKGKVQIFGGGTLLPGVAVQVAGATQANAATDAQGAFDVPVSAGTHTLTYSIAGYHPVVQQVALSQGSMADVGIVYMRAARTTSSLRGLVTDTSGQGIPGAIVAIQGGASATANAGGAYAFSDLTGTQLTVRVSASGYGTRDFTLGFSQPGDYVQDFRLRGNSMGYLSLQELQLSAASAGLRRDVTATALVTNPSLAESSAVADAIVLAPDGGHIARIVALDATGQPLPVLTLAPGAQQKIHYKWNTGGFAPGSYKLVARLAQPGSATRELPDGELLATQQQALAITTGASFIGSVTADPPVLRAGTNTVVKLSAVLQNDGNVTLPAQDYKLAIVDTKSGQVTATRTVSAQAVPTVQLQALTFDNWTPQGGGSFRLELSAPSTPGPLVTASLYVGDAGSAEFTVDKPFVHAGSQTVRGTVKVTGQNVANGTINDPLAPLIQEAIKTSVAKADTLAYDHYVNRPVGAGKCFLCHVQPHALVGGERNLQRVAPVDKAKRTTLLNGITQLIQSNGEINRDNWMGRTNTTLGLWAASEWHNQPSVAMSKRLMADYLISRQDANGSWAVDHNATWWRTRTPLVALNIASFAALKSEVLAGQTPTYPVMTPLAISGLPTGSFYMNADAAGNLYLAMWEQNKVYKIPAGASNATVFWSGTRPMSVYPISGGRVVIGGGAGIHVVGTTPADIVQISNRAVRDAQPYGEGRYLVSFENQGVVQILEPNGTLTPFISDSVLGGYAMPPVQQPDGSLVIPGYRSQKVARFNPQGQLIDVPVTFMPSTPHHALPYRDGMLVSSQMGTFYFDKEWAAERWSFERSVGMAKLPDGRVLVNCNGRLCEMTTAPVDATALASRLENAIGKSATWLRDGGVNSAEEYRVGWGQHPAGAANPALCTDAARPWYPTPEEACQGAKAVHPVCDRASATYSNHVATLVSGGTACRVTWTYQNIGGGGGGSFSATHGIERCSNSPTCRKDSNSNIDIAFRLMGLGKAKLHFAGTTRANEFDAKMAELGDTLRSRQRPDGGWLWKQGVESCGAPIQGSCSDPMVTAMVGLALDTLNPSPNSPQVRNAITYLLSHKNSGNGMWYSVHPYNNGAGLADTPLMASTWVDIWLSTMLERLGGINTDLSIDLPASVTLSNPDTTPTTSTVNPGGSSTYVWKLIGVTETNRAVNFDLLLMDMQIDEVRPVAQQANLVFRNTFVAGSVTAAIEVPKVAVGTTLIPGVSTDKPEYTDANIAIFTGTASNAGTATRTATVRFTVLDAADQVVEVLPLGPSITVPGSGGTSTVANWPAAGVLSGNYVLKAELISPSGLLYGTATTSFAVTASQAQAAGARITTDRVSYSAAQSVQLNSRVANLTDNTPLEAVEAVTVVTSAGGQGLFTRTEPIDQLAAPGNRQYGYTLPANSLPAGGYSASLQLRSATGSVLAQSTTGFTVLGAEQTGVGLAGQLKANPATPFVGQVTMLGLDATNNSASALTQVPLTVRLVDPVARSVVASYTATVADWQPGSTHSFSFPWSAVGGHGQIFVASAVAEIAGKKVPLAQAQVKVLGILFTGSVDAQPKEVEQGDPAALSYTVMNPTAVNGRMLGALSVRTEANEALQTWPLELSINGLSTFAGNQLYTTGEQLQTLTAVLSQQLGTSTVVLSTSSFRIIDRPVPLAVDAGLKGQARVLVLVSCPPGLGAQKDEACVAQRSQSIVAYLSSLGITAKAVRTGEAFLVEMRCGTYNTYWISGGATKLDASTIGELREAVHRGEALWMDGVHDSRNQLLHDAAGVKHIGKLPARNQVAALADGSLYGSQNLPTLGQSTRFELTTGTSQGGFGADPAVVSNDYGRGKSLLYAFDLAGMITADSVGADAQLAGFVRASASHAASASPTLTLGDITQLSASITNQGTRTVAFKAEATLPAGLNSVATAPSAQLTINSDGTMLATWNFTLAGGATQELTSQVRAAQTGSYSVPFAIYSMPNPGSALPPKLRTSANVVLEVQDAAQVQQPVPPSLEALQPTASSDKSNKTKAVNAVSQALALHAQEQYEQAIGQWLAAADALLTISSADTRQARAAVALALEASTDALCIQRCGSASCQ